MSLNINLEALSANNTRAYHNIFSYFFISVAVETIYVGNMKSLLLTDSPCMFIDIQKRIKIYTDTVYSTV